MINRNTFETSTPERPRTPHRTLGSDIEMHVLPHLSRNTKRYGAVALIAAGLLTGNAINNLSSPEFSDKTTRVSGENLWEISQKVEGSDDVDRWDVINYIENMPENAETLDDGLQKSEVVEIPLRVKN